MSYSELEAEPRWHRTGHRYFPAAAEVDGRWWVLRINAFPDHPLWTLFVDGVRCFDIDDTPSTWGEPLDPTASALEVRTAQAVLNPLRHFAAYASEVGDPCDNHFCCDPRLDDDREHWDGSA
ncbi:hypothetical protein ACFPZN_49770 [Actinomadura rugatobispora]|uniref:DUF402 domain-containing protein n=2 Tax=Actinomadura rugatobispora TaxID=1994 RepID=A0ABW1AGX7_9ACTN|nr:hypothetical protein GCM10010200_092900 [Actinomadura rugatobispora]